MAKKTQNQEPVKEEKQSSTGIAHLTDTELERIAVKFNSSGQYGTMKAIHKALVHYNRYLKGEIQKDEL